MSDEHNPQPQPTRSSLVSLAFATLVVLARYAIRNYRVVPKPSPVGNPRSIGGLDAGSVAATVVTVLCVGFLAFAAYLYLSGSP